MYKLKKSRKIILVITGDVRDSIRITMYSLKKAQQFGFEVLGLSIEDTSLEMLLPNAKSHHS